MRQRCYNIAKTVATPASDRLRCGHGRSPKHAVVIATALPLQDMKDVLIFCRLPRRHSAASLLLRALLLGIRGQVFVLRLRALLLGIRVQVFVLRLRALLLGIRVQVFVLRLRK